MSAERRILIVEDQKIVAADLESTLSRLGYAVVGTAASGEEAIRKASELGPSLVLMDIRLHGEMDGIEAAEAIAERFGIPIVYLTAYADEETILRARSTVPFGYLVKPFNERELRGAIEVALYKYETDRQLRARELELTRAEARRRAAEEAETRLRESEARFRLLADNVREVFWISDPDFTRFHYVSPAYEAIWGRPAAELDRDPGAFLDAVHPDDRERLLQAMAKLGKGAETSLEYRILRPHGELRWLRARGFPVRDSAGSVYRVVGVTEDFTEHRQRDEDLRFLGEASRLLASSLDYEKTLERVAHIAVPRIGDWCGVDVLEHGRIQRLAVAHADPAKVELARELARRYPPDPAATVGVGQVLRNGQPQLLSGVQESLLRAVARDDEHFAILHELGVRSAMIVPMVARGGVLGAITFVAAESGRRYDEDDLAFATELADRAAASIDNARLYEQAVVANQAKSDFLAVMSHELRTPLNAVMGYADLLELKVQGPLTAGQHEQIARIKASANHLLHLIEQILTFSRLEAGREELEIERIDLGELLRGVADMVRPLAEEKGLRFLLRTPAQRFDLETDASKVRQVLLNLLSNAIKFTERGEIELAADVTKRSVALSVRDTGIGILRQHREHLFDPFWQAEQKPTRRAGGTGLGLSVTKRLARMLGGDISVASRRGKGSTFTVRLPVEARQAAGTA